MPKIKAVRKPKRLFAFGVLDEKELGFDAQEGEDVYEVTVVRKFKARFTKSDNKDDIYAEGDLIIPEAK